MGYGSRPLREWKQACSCSGDTAVVAWIALSIGRKEAWHGSGDRIGKSCQTPPRFAGLLTARKARQRGPERQNVAPCE